MSLLNQTLMQILFVLSFLVFRTETTLCTHLCTAIFSCWSRNMKPATASQWKNKAKHLITFNVELNHDMYIIICCSTWMMTWKVPSKPRVCMVGRNLGNSNPIICCSLQTLRNLMYLLGLWWEREGGGRKVATALKPQHRQLLETC